MFLLNERIISKMLSFELYYWQEKLDLLKYFNEIVNI